MRSLTEVRELTDGVVRLRPWAPDDVGSLVRAWNDPELSARLPVPEARDDETATRWIAGWRARTDTAQAIDLVVCEVPSSDAVGEVGLSAIDPDRRAALIGWWLDRGSRGRGLAQRAVTLIVDWAFAPDRLDALVAEIDPDNEPSLRLAARCGFEFLTVRGESGRQVHVRRRSDSRRSDRATAET